MWSCAPCAGACARVRWGAARAAGYGCRWCNAFAYCTEAALSCDEGCIGGPIYLTCGELGGIIALTVITAVVGIAVAAFAFSRHRLLDRVGTTDVYARPAAARAFPLDAVHSQAARPQASQWRTAGATGWTGCRPRYLLGRER